MWVDVGVPRTLVPETGLSKGLNVTCGILGSKSSSHKDLEASPSLILPVPSVQAEHSSGHREIGQKAQSVPVPPSARLPRPQPPFH